MDETDIAALILVFVSFCISIAVLTLKRTPVLSYIIPQLCIHLAIWFPELLKDRPVTSWWPIILFMASLWTFFGSVVAHILWTQWLQYIRK